MNNKTKVLYFVDTMNMGGIQSLLINWISRFDRNKIQVDFLLLDDGKKYKLEENLKKLECKVYKLDDVWIERPLDFMKESKALDRFFKDHHDYKAVHMHSSSKNFLVLKYAKKFRIPIRIIHSHSTNFQTKSLFKKIIGSILKIQLVKYATDFFACSKESGKWLFGNKVVNSDRFKVIHNAIDYDKFGFDEQIRKKIRQEFKIKDNELLVGNVGRFISLKNHTFLIDIFNEMLKINKNIKLIMVGIGEEKEKIERKVKKLGIEKNIIFAGFRKNVNELMQGMDVFLLPSLYEGFPVVSVEAQAAGLPCFMSKNVITEETKITDNVIFISLKENASKWAKIILDYKISRKETKNQIKGKGYLIEDLVRDLENFYITSE